MITNCEKYAKDRRHMIVKLRKGKSIFLFLRDFTKELKCVLSFFTVVSYCFRRYSVVCLKIREILVTDLYSISLGSSNAPNRCLPTANKQVEDEEEEECGERTDHIKQ